VFRSLRRVWCAILWVQSAVVVPSADACTIWDATAYVGKTSEVSQLLRPVPLIYGSEVWSSGQSRANLPDETSFKEIVRRKAGSSPLLVLNIEDWKTVGPAEEVAATVSKLSTLVAWAKAALPNTQVGIYSLVPVRDYWVAQKPLSDPRFAKWELENDALLPLATNVDVLFPSLYTFYPDRDGWRKYAVLNIAQGRRLAPGKPMYVFLWHEYHTSSVNKGKEVEHDYWTEQLEIACRYTNGAVVWGGWDLVTNKPKAFHEDLPWWRSTKAFLQSRRAKS
jgi:hypothetical protein